MTALRYLLDIVEVVKERGAGFCSLAEDIDTTTPAGELNFHAFVSIAYFERRRIAERTREGLAAARKRGRPCLIVRSESRGHPHARHQATPVAREIASLFKASVQTIRRACVFESMSGSCKEY